MFPRGPRTHDRHPGQRPFLRRPAWSCCFSVQRSAFSGHADMPPAQQRSGAHAPIVCQTARLPAATATATAARGVNVFFLTLRRLTLARPRRRLQRLALALALAASLPVASHLPRPRMHTHCLSLACRSFVSSPLFSPYTLLPPQHRISQSSNSSSPQTLHTNTTWPHNGAGHASMPSNTTSPVGHHSSTSPPEHGANANGQQRPACTECQRRKQKVSIAEAWNPETQS